MTSLLVSEIISKVLILEKHRGKNNPDNCFRQILKLIDSETNYIKEYYL